MQPRTLVFVGICVGNAVTYAGYCFGRPLVGAIALLSFGLFLLGVRFLEKLILASTCR